MIVFHALHIASLILLILLLFWQGYQYRVVHAPGHYAVLSGFVLVLISATVNASIVLNIPLPPVILNPNHLLILQSLGYLLIISGIWQWGQLLNEILQQRTLLQQQQAQLEQIETALNCSQMQFKQLFNQSAMGMLLTDSDGKIVEVNANYADMLGYSIDELQQQNCLTHVHPQQRAEYQHLSDNLISGQQDHYRLESRLLRKDEQVIWADIAATTLHNIKQTGTLQLQLVQENTLRKEDELQLQRNYEELLCHIEKSPLGMIEWDAELRIQRWTPQATIIFGWQAEEVLDKPFTDWQFLHEEDRTEAINYLQSLLANTTEPTVKRWHFYTYTGKVIYCEWHISVCGLTDCQCVEREQAQYLSFMAFVQDVTQREQMHQTLQHNQDRLSQANAELQHANRLKDEFLANMSHELRTPLSSILGMAEILNDCIYGEINERQQKAVERIYTSGQSLLSLINDILDLARIEANKTKLELAPMPIQEVCQSSIAFIKEQAHQKHISIEVDTKHAPEMIHADMRRLHQILVNLLSNAVKFTPVGGKVGLTISLGENHQSVKFTVWDTGIGIDKMDMQKLFKPFTQLDSSFTRNYQGTGLGLALVQRLTELHGGSLELFSEIDKGSTFSVILPQHQEALSRQAEVLSEHLELPDAQQAVPIIRDQAGLILLAEDNPSNIETFVAYLRHKRYRVNIARTGLEVLESLEEIQPDVILMDIQMPEMDGLEATRRIRANPNWCKIPIIALTALTMSGDRERCLEAGVNEYLSKPISLRNLQQTIERYTQPKKGAE